MAGGKRFGLLPGQAFHQFHGGFVSQAYCQVDCVPFTVIMRELNREQVERYVQAERRSSRSGLAQVKGRRRRASSSRR